MTGEVTLQGRVLPIGGVKQKVLAAHRAGLTEVILPKRNEGDLDDVPEQVREQMTFHLVDDVREVLAVALRADGGGRVGRVNARGLRGDRRDRPARSWRRRSSAGHMRRPRSHVRLASTARSDGGPRGS